MELVKMTLKAARVNKSLTQKKAAELIGISESTLYNYERGITFPNGAVIKRIVEVYGVGYDNLIFLPQDND